MKECTFKPKINKVYPKFGSTRLSINYSNGHFLKQTGLAEKSQKDLEQKMAEKYTLKPKINKVPNAPKKVIIVPNNNNDIIWPCAIDSELKKKKADEIRAYLDGIQLTEQTLTKKKEILQKIKAAYQGQLNSKDDLKIFDNENVLKQTYYIDDGFEENLLFIGDNAEGISACVSKNNHDVGAVVSGPVCINNGAVNINNKAAIIIPWIQNRSMSKRPKDSHTPDDSLPEHTLTGQHSQSEPQAFGIN